jgi:hypothetical protein
MQCVNSVCVVMQKNYSPTAKRQNLIAAYCYSVHVPLVRQSLVYVKCVEERGSPYLYPSLLGYKIDTGNALLVGG